MSDVWAPFWLSLQVAVWATLLTAAVAIPLAYAMARRTFPGKSLVEAVITVPLVLPPTVVGYLIIVTLGARGWQARGGGRCSGTSRCRWRGGGSPRGWCWPLLGRWGSLGRR